MKQTDVLNPYHYGRVARIYYYTSIFAALAEPFMTVNKKGASKVETTRITPLIGPHILQFYYYPLDRIEIGIRMWTLGT